MKRLLIMFMAMAMTFGSVASAEAAQVRTLQGSYRLYPAPVTGCNEVLGSWACMIVRTLPAERFVTAKVTDTHGLPVFFVLSNPGAGFWKGFCGETKGPVLFPGRYLEIEVGVYRGVAQTDCPASSVKTTGTIRVTLSD